MSKKSKGLVKFLIACGIVISAVAAVFAVFYRMHSKLKSVDCDEQLEDEGSCNGNCEGCNLCGDDADTDEDSAETDEVEDIEE